MTTAPRRRTIAATLIASAGLAAIAAPAAAQYDFFWAVSADGDWSDPANWAAISTPGAASVLDTATINAAGTYTAFVDVSRAIADLAITNADATVEIEPNRTLTLSGALSGPGQLILSNGASTFDARLNMGASSTINTHVVLNGVATGDADLQLPADPLTPTTLGPNGIISGQGNITGHLINQGLLLADNGTLDLSLGDLRVEGGTVRQETTGNFQWDGHTIANLTVENDLILDPNEFITLDTGVTFTGDIIISNGASTFDARLTVLDGVTIDTTIVLQGVATGDADLQFPLTAGESATLSPTGVIRGQGNITGFLNNQGHIIADNGQIDLSLADARLDGGMIQQTTNGDIRWDAHTIANLTVIDDLIIDPNETVFVDTGVTFTGDIIISEGTSTFDARLNVLDDVTIDNTTIILQGVAAADADLIFPGAPGELGTLGTSTTVTGQGTLSGFMLNQGRIVATPGNQIDFSLADLTINGGTLEQQAGGDFRWDNHLVTNATLEGQIIIDPSEILNIGPNVTFTEGVTVSNAASTFDARLALTDGVNLDTTVTLLGLAAGDARLTGPISPASATLAATSTLAGQGTLDSNITELNGHIAPDDEGTGGRINLFTSNDLAFAPTTELAIDIYSTFDFDDLSTNANLTLAGTLSLVPDAAYVPMLGDEFIVITSGLPMTGTFDTISEIPGTTPYIVRARYEPTRVTAIITCLQDLSGDGITDIDDVLAFLDAFSNQNKLADLALPIGEYNIDDVLTFLDLFAQGCF